MTRLSVVGAALAVICATLLVVFERRSRTQVEEFEDWIQYDAYLHGLASGVATSATG